jgi:hypothetical protein
VLSICKDHLDRGNHLNSKVDVVVSIILVSAMLVSLYKTTIIKILTQ